MLKRKALGAEEVKDSSSTIEIIKKPKPDSEYMDKIVQNLICPLSQQIFYNPVATNCGHIFEHDAIKQMFELDRQHEHNKCPYVGARFEKNSFLCQRLEI